MRTARRPRLVAELIADNAPQSLDAVFPGNLLAFFVRAPRISNRHFVDAPLVLCDLGRNLRFESKSVRLDLNSRQNLSPENLVTRLHIRQLQVREDIR